ncbi:fluoride efflux transporter family protein [Corynebacterium alimapuense]|uniref:Fluoride-specific ion channel FluC n=1 Tax=Corynebacterium alimapuense TaxID=1576874 RepID=A0A3M8K992_9CORY|nr:fluoride efflux transporter family protein [Corynebacterium alimapuense]RNE49797.1 fluoride efflux transporter family protein [Corynebacterium alimapuense]
MRESLGVGVGAMLGALARYGIQITLGAGMWPLLAVNILGSFLMGATRPSPFWGTGVLGGFTSFSTFALLTASAELPVALGYAVLMLSSCVGAWLLGDRLADQ